MVRFARGVSNVALTYGGGHHVLHEQLIARVRCEGISSSRLQRLCCARSKLSDHGKEGAVGSHPVQRHWLCRCIQNSERKFLPMRLLVWARGNEARCGGWTPSEQHDDSSKQCIHKASVCACVVVCRVVCVCDANAYIRGWPLQASLLQGHN